MHPNETIVLWVGTVSFRSSHRTKHMAYITELVTHDLMFSLWGEVKSQKYRLMHCNKRSFDFRFQSLDLQYRYIRTLGCIPGVEVGVENIWHLSLGPPGAASCPLLSFSHGNQSRHLEQCCRDNSWNREGKCFGDYFLHMAHRSLWSCWR